MELIVLVDNATVVDRYLTAEPGLAILVREAGRTLLFDCGYSDIVCRNAAILGIDLAAVDTVVLSHGHLDHTWGLFHLMAYLTGQAQLDRPAPRPALLAHPEALAPRFYGGLPIGCPIERSALDAVFAPDLSPDPVFLTDNLAFLGAIPRRRPEDASPPVGMRHADTGPVPDDLPDDTALAYRSAEGLVIVTGCSHAGIANIVEQAREVMAETRVAAIIGGLHLHDAGPERIAATVDFLRDCGQPTVFPCHCTGLAATVALAGAMRVEAVGVGTRLVFAQAG